MKTQRFFTYVTAAALAAGTFGVAGCKDDHTASTNPDNRTAGEKVADAGKKASEKVGEGVDATNAAAKDAAKETKEMANKAGEKIEQGAEATKDAAKDASQQASATLSPSGSDKLTGVRSTIEGVVQNAVKRNEWDDMADHFTAADKQRVMNGKPDTKALDDLGEKFTTAYRGEFKDAFTIMDADEKFGPDFLKITATTDANAKEAIATLPESHGLPALELKFVDEGGKWRLDIPDSVDAQKLHANLTKALTDLQDVKKLGADENQAARHAAHRILAAAVDKG